MNNSWTWKLSTFTLIFLFFNFFRVGISLCLKQALKSTLLNKSSSTRHSLSDFLVNCDRKKILFFFFCFDFFEYSSYLSIIYQLMYQMLHIPIWSSFQNKLWSGLERAHYLPMQNHKTWNKLWQNGCMLLAFRCYTLFQQVMYDRIYTTTEMLILAFNTVN